MEPITPETFKDAKAGDKIFEVFSHWGTVSMTMVIIRKVTATQIVVGGRRYKKETGREIGEKYSPRSIYPFIKETEDAYSAQQIRSEIDAMMRYIEVNKNRVRAVHGNDLNKLNDLLLSVCKTLDPKYGEEEK